MQSFPGTDHKAFPHLATLSPKEKKQAGNFRCGTYAFLLALCIPPRCFHSMDDSNSPSYVALSLHEDYAPAWKVWEGVRELVQGCDGALDAALQSSWSAAESIAWCAVLMEKPIACIIFDAEKRRLLLVNKDTGLRRKVLLLVHLRRRTLRRPLANLVRA